MTPFSVVVDEDALQDLRERLIRTRYPPPGPAEAWVHGTDLAYLSDLVGYWSGAFDWREQEAWLNSFQHRRVEIDGLQVHVVHEPAVHGGGLPLILTHGWPSCFVEYLPLVPLLTDPASHGIDGPAFDVVIPSLPGYGFSERPQRGGVTTRVTAALWHRLMAGLGYQRYGAHGSDFGSAVTTFMALDQPEPMLGIHLSNLDVPPYLGPGARPLTDAEQAYISAHQRWADDDRGYGVIQSTRPQTLSYGLTDSPAGLAAWIIEKWRGWSDCAGDIESRFSRDFLLTIVTLYWITGTISTSVLDYVDNREIAAVLTAGDRVGVPTAVAVFGHQFIDDGSPPREWAGRMYDVRQFTVMPRGGHFAAAEEPELMARDIASFFGGL
jgi:pimeloyl-ACP methyl ester carboxylesterase